MKRLYSNAIDFGDGLSILQQVGRPFCRRGLQRPSRRRGAPPAPPHGAPRLYPSKCREFGGRPEQSLYLQNMVLEKPNSECALDRHLSALPLSFHRSVRISPKSVAIHGALFRFFPRFIRFARGLTPLKTIRRVVLGQLRRRVVFARGLGGDF
jgi:hypothetical protein